jgi:2'-5' RNA ligase
LLFSQRHVLESILRLSKVKITPSSNAGGGTLMIARGDKLINVDANDDSNLKIRCFLALKTPAEWDKPLEDLQKKLRDSIRSKGVRWVPVKQMHLTLRFFGWLSLSNAADVKALAAAICSKTSTLTLRSEGLGCFPSPRRPRVLWAGLAGDIEAICNLQNQLAQTTRAFGEPPDDRPFTPHLTLARFKEVQPLMAKVLEENGDFEIHLPWRIQEVRLMQSHLAPNGARYETIGCWNLSQ